MKMGFLLMLSGLLFSLKVRSQQLSPSVMASAGGRSGGGDMTLDWTLGEYAVETVPTSARLYTQGFHQPLLFARTLYAADANQLQGYAVSIAPNPVLSVLNVTLELPAGEPATLSLVSLLGQNMLSKETSGSGLTRLDLSGYTPGIYLLTVKTLTGKMIQSFKIIKAQ